MVGLLTSVGTEVMGPANPLPWDRKRQGPGRGSDRVLVPAAPLEPAAPVSLCPLKAGADRGHGARRSATPNRGCSLSRRLQCDERRPPMHDVSLNVSRPLCSLLIKGLASGQGLPAEAQIPRLSRYGSLTPLDGVQEPYRKPQRYPRPYVGLRRHKI